MARQSGTDEGVSLEPGGRKLWAGTMPDKIFLVFYLDIRKQFVSDGASQGSGGVVESPSLKVCKKHLDVALRDMA